MVRSSQWLCGTGGARRTISTHHEHTLVRDEQGAPQAHATRALDMVDRYCDSSHTEIPCPACTGSGDASYATHRPRGDTTGAAADCARGARGRAGADGGSHAGPLLPATTRDATGVGDGYAVP